MSFHSCLNVSFQFFFTILGTLRFFLHVYLAFHIYSYTISGSIIVNAQSFYLIHIVFQALKIWIHKSLTTYLKNPQLTKLKILLWTVYSSFPKCLNVIFHFFITILQTQRLFLHGFLKFLIYSYTIPVFIVVNSKSFKFIHIVFTAVLTWILKGFNHFP